MQNLSLAQRWARLGPYKPRTGRTASQLVTLSTCHTVKSCDELTVLSEGVVTS